MVAGTARQARSRGMGVPLTEGQRLIRHRLIFGSSSGNPGSSNENSQTSIMEFLADLREWLEGRPKLREYAARETERWKYTGVAEYPLAERPALY